MYAKRREGRMEEEGEGEEEEVREGGKEGEGDLGFRKEGKELCNNQLTVMHRIVSGLWHRPNLVSSAKVR